MTRAALHSDLVNRLLFLGSAAQIRQAVVAIRGLDLRALEAALSEHASERRAAGFVAESRLADRVLGIVRSLSVGSAAATTVTTPDELIAALAQALNGLAMRQLLTRHRALATDALFDHIERIVTDRSTPQHSSEQLVLPLAVLGALLGGERRARGHLFWARRCADADQLAPARRHATRVLHLIDPARDQFMWLTAQTLRASLLDQEGSTGEAAAAYEGAITFARATEHANMAPLLRRSLAGCYRSLGRPDDALTELDLAIGDVRAMELESREADYCGFRGLVLEDLGRYEDGAVAFETAARLAHRTGDLNIELTALTNLAASFMKRHLEREAIRRFEAALRVAERTGNPIAVGSALNNLADALLGVGDAEDALALFQQALQVKVNTSTRGEVITLLGMGDALVRLGRHDEADGFYSFATVPVLETGDVTSAALLLGRMKPDSGSNGFIGLLDHAHATGNVNDELMLAIAHAGFFQRSGRHGDALGLCEQVIARHPRLAGSLLGARLLALYGELLADTPGRRCEAYAVLSSVIEYTELQIAATPLHERRSEIVSESIHVIAKVIELLLAHAEELALPAVQQPLAIAFLLHEAAKSRAHAARMADAPMPAPDTIPEPLRAREAELLAEQRALQAPTSSDREPLSARLPRLRDGRQALLACWKRIEPFAPRYARLRSGEPVDLDELGEMLQRQPQPMAVVSWFCDASSTTCFVLRSDTRGVQVIRKPLGAPAIHEAALRLRRAFNGAPHEFPPYPPLRGEHPFNRALSMLDELSPALTSFAEATAGVELVLCAPHGPLHLLPIHALRTADGRYLAERHAIVYCASLTSAWTALARAHAAPAIPRRPALYVAGVAALEDEDPAFYENERDIFDDGRWQLTCDLAPRAASKHRVLEQFERSDVIHLACHGFFDERSPLDSGLVFSDGGERPPRDPRSVPVHRRGDFVLSVREILERTLVARLVTLRACSTGLQASLNQGDELTGLSNALLRAGASSLLVTLWNVDQRSSLRFLQRFYDHWLDRQQQVPKWRALWQTQRELLTLPDQAFLSHPYHWAPFVISGDWR